MGKALVLNLPFAEDFNAVETGNTLNWSPVDPNTTSKYESDKIFSVEPVIKSTSSLKDFNGNVLTNKAVYFGNKGIKGPYSSFSINPEYFVEDFYNSEISYTVSLWFNSTYNTASPTFSQTYARYYSNGDSYTQNFTPRRKIISIDYIFYVYIQGNGLYVTGKDNNSLISNYAFTANIWHNIAICYNGEIQKAFLYFDGEMIASSTYRYNISNYYTSKSVYIAGTWYQNYWTNNEEQDYKVHTYNSYVGYISNVQVYIGLAKWPDGVINIEETKTADTSSEYTSKRKNIDTGIIKDTILHFPFEKDTSEKDNKVSWNYVNSDTIIDTSNIEDRYGNKPYAKTYRLYGCYFKFLELFKKDCSITFNYNISDLWKNYRILSNEANNDYSYLILNIMGSYKYNNFSTNLHTVPVINIGYRNGYLYFIFCKNYDIKANNNFRTYSVFSNIKNKYSYPQHISIGLRIPFKLEDVINKWCEISISYLYKTNTFNLYINSLFAGSVQIKNFNLSEYIYYFGIRAGLDSTYGEGYHEYKTENNKSIFVKYWRGQYIRDIEINMINTKYIQTTEKYNEKFKYHNFIQLYSNLSNDNKESWDIIGSPVIKDIPNLEPFNPDIYPYFEKAAYFNGSSGLLYKEKLLDLFRDDFTFYCWVKNEMTDKNERFILRLLNGLPSASSYYSSVLEIFYNKSKYNIGIRRAAYYNISTSSMSTGSKVKEEFYLNTILDPEIGDNWYNVAFCYKHSEKKIYFYINGELINTQLLQSDLQLYSYYIWLGFGLQSSSNYGFIGYMKNVYLESGIARWTKDKFDLHEILFYNFEEKNSERIVEHTRRAIMYVVGPSSFIR